MLPIILCLRILIYIYKFIIAVFFLFMLVSLLLLIIINLLARAQAPLVRAVSILLSVGALSELSCLLFQFRCFLSARFFLRWAVNQP